MNQAPSQAALADAEVMTLPRLLRRHAAARPGEVALRQKRRGVWEETSWADYEAAAARFAAGMAARGFRRGDHVGILSENRREWLIAELGLHCLGAAPVGVYPTSPGPEIRHVLAATDCRAVICEDQEQVDKLLSILEELPLIETIIAIDGKGLRAYDHPKLTRYEAVMADGGAAEAPGYLDRLLADHRPDDTALIICTSGSTGPPKAAMISFRNIAAVGRMTAEITAPVPRDRVLSYLPLCHVAEQLFSVFVALNAGYSVHFGESLRTVQSDLREVAPTIFLGVPRIWEKMMSDLTLRIAEAGPLQRLFLGPAMRLAGRGAGRRGPKARALEWTVFRPLRDMLGLTRCHSAFSGAAPIAPETLAFFRGIGVPLMEGFGMTETSGTACVQRRDRPGAGRVGRPLPGVEAKLADDGELLIRGEIVFTGYYKRGDATREAIREGWLHTGDIAEIHEDGTLSIIDRKKDVMITAGGKNLTPSLIENAMKASPYIKECVVIADGRRFPAALIQIDWDAATSWAERRGIAYTTFRSLAENPETRRLIETEVATRNRRLSGAEQVKKFHLLTRELDHDDGEVTATMKVRRAKIAEGYAREIEALYA